MAKKLTLNIDSELIDFAHQYSKETHQSISKVIENFLSDLKGIESTNGLPSKTKNLYGALDTLEVVDKKSMRKLFHEKSFN